MNSIKCICENCTNCDNKKLVKVDKQELEILIMKLKYYEESYNDLKVSIEEFVNANSDKNGKFATSKIIGSITSGLPSLLTGNSDGINRLMDKIKLQNLITKGAEIIEKDKQTKPWENQK